MFGSEVNSCFFAFIFSLISVMRFSSSQDGLNTDNSWTVQNGILNFGSKLNKILHSYNFEDRNILFSPINIYAALLLTHLGSNGKTRSELNNILGIGDSDQWPGVHEKFNRIFESLANGAEMGAFQERNINISNAIFVDRVNLVKNYVKRVRSQYNSDIINVNFLSEEFEAVKIINKYIAGRVKNRIPKFYTKPQTPYPKVILTSCLNFESWWKFPFRESTTQRDTFYSTHGPITVNMMQRVGKMAYANIPSLGAEIGKLVTRNTNISLFVVLPYKQYSLRYFLDNVTPDDIKLMVSSVVEEHFVDFKLPRTVLKWYENLNKTLSRFGARDVFAWQADFSNIIKAIHFDVNEIQYVADIKIAEHKIEISSVTSVKISPSVVIEPLSNPFHELLGNELIFFNNLLGKFSNVEFYVDRPFFIFMYHHEIESVLYFGAINDPNGV